jgi:hypothetical protein
MTGSILDRIILFVTIVLRGIFLFQASSTNNKGKSMDIEGTDAGETDKALSSKTVKQKDSVESVIKQISGIAISESHATPSTNTTNNSQPESSAPDIDKKIRALKKKVYPCPLLCLHIFYEQKDECEFSSELACLNHFPHCHVWAW